MNNKHPAAFPTSLISRIVSSTNAKLILDPFMGSGTTAISAIEFKRNYVGIDISPEYCKMANERIKGHKSRNKLGWTMNNSTVIYTKTELIAKLKEIAARGFVKNTRKGNAGGVGNTLEDLLWVKENNLPIPNTAEWELKTQRIDTTSLTTLFHIEPSPRALKFVPKIFLLKYGWPHKEAGKKYPRKEISFRQTIHGKTPSDRGFKVVIEHNARKILISFNSEQVSPRHAKWLKKVKTRVGLGELNPQPYWGFDDLAHKAGTKLINCFYVQAEVKEINGDKYYYYIKVLMLQRFSFEKFLNALEAGVVLIDFDARTGHNHGTKFRMRQDSLPMLYEEVTVIL